MSRILLASLAVLASASALAQQPAPPATPAPALGGPEIHGVCLLSQQVLFATSKVGQAATARLKELAQQAQAEVDADRKPTGARINVVACERPLMCGVELAVGIKRQGMRWQHRAIFEAHVPLAPRDLGNAPAE